MEESDKNFVFLTQGVLKPTIVNTTYRYTKEEYLRRLFRDVYDTVKMNGPESEKLKKMLKIEQVKGIEGNK